MKGCLIWILIFLGFTMFGGVIIVALGMAMYLVELLLPIAVVVGIGYLIYWAIKKDSNKTYSPKRNSKRRKR